jgi:hypothetical protein
MSVTGVPEGTASFAVLLFLYHINCVEIYIKEMIQEFDGNSTFWNPRSWI